MLFVYMQISPVAPDAYASAGLATPSLFANRFRAQYLMGFFTCPASSQAAAARRRPAPNASHVWPSTPTSTRSSSVTTPLRSCTVRPQPLSRSARRALDTCVQICPLERPTPVLYTRWRGYIAGVYMLILWFSSPDPAMRYIQWFTETHPARMRRVYSETYPVVHRDASRADAACLQ